MNANIGLTNNCGVSPMASGDNLMIILLLLMCFSPNMMASNDSFLLILILLMSTSGCGFGNFNRGIC